MRLHRIEVTNFAGIRVAAIEFGPGLNVCFGPNELGKSTLVRAIRAALLLQDSSAAAEALRDWYADAPPTVAVDFETEAQRIWRVRKSFGSGRDGWSYLEFSRDGQTFVQEVRGREVDGRLSELLRWGFDAPGGQGRRRRGIPESFITTALLGEQDDVVAILDRSLEQDPDESGKQRLTEALQAMAEHPLFRQVLEAAQTKFDEAFTATGRRKSGRSSPWVRLRDDLQEAKHQEGRLNEQLQESEAARVRIQELQRDLLEAQAGAREALGAQRRVADAWTKHQARAEAQEALSQAQIELARIQGLAESVRGAEQALERTKEDAEALRAATEAAQEHFRGATVRTEEARSRVRELEGGAAEQQRRLREQEIEKRLLGLDAREKELVRQVERAERAGELARRAQELRDEIGKLERTLEDARSVLRDARGAFEQDQRELERLDRQARVARYLEASRTLGEADKALAAARASRAEADRLQANADALRREVESWRVPSRESLDGLRNIEMELRIAEEKLHVGLTVTFAAEAKVELDVSIDGEDHTASAHRGAQTEFEARSRVTLRIPNVGEVDIRGGTRDLLDAAAACRERWNAAAQPVFADVGCESLAEAEALRERARGRLEEAQGIDAKAAAARARAEGLETLEVDRGGRSEALSKAEASLTASLPDGATVEAFIKAQGDDRRDGAIEDSIAELQAKLEKRKELAAKLEVQVSRDEGRLQGLREELGAQERELEREREGLADDLAVVLEQSQRALSDARTQRAGSQRQLEAVRTEATSEVDEARSQLEGCERGLVDAKGAAESAKQKSDAAQATVARLEGELTIRRQAAEREDADAARELTERRAAALSALPEPESEVSRELCEGADQRVQQSQSDVHALELRLRQAEGALEQVGGQYIEEQVLQAREAVLAATEREHETDVDYGAWGLLLETLKEAESEDVVHLGNALVEPVSERMSALTAGRLSSLSLEPLLQTRGIELGGAERRHETLSVGTREQLATVLRLSIAEALGSFLVLDDQLTQSDPARMDWFREVLRNAAGDIQVVVFTCRPADYLTADEIVAAPLDGPVRAVDLTRIVERNPSGSDSKAPRTPTSSSAIASGAEKPEGPPAQASSSERNAAQERTKRRGSGSSSSVPDLMAALKDSLKDDD